MVHSGLAQTQAAGRLNHPSAKLAGGYVKAPNGFGNAIASEWPVLFSENADKLHLLAVRIDGKLVYADKAIR